MQIKKNIFLLTIVILISISNITYGEDTNDCSTFSNKSGYELYKQRVECICDQYKSNSNIVNIKKEYKKVNIKTYSLATPERIHRENMNTIYKCGLLTTQKKSLLLIKNDLIKKSPVLGKRIEGKINSNISKIDSLINNIGCTNSNTKSSVIKLELLKQTTYQTCKYISYLEYLKEYNRNTQNLFDPTKTRYTPTEIANKELDEINKINDEIKHTYTIFPLAFHAYTEYENNITAHFLLQLLRDDYITFREKLHKSLNPINQVVYKIVNAMKK